MPKIICKMPGQSLVSAKCSINLGSPPLSSGHRLPVFQGCRKPWAYTGKGEVSVFKHRPLGRHCPCVWLSKWTTGVTMMKDFLVVGPDSSDLGYDPVECLCQVSCSDRSTFTRTATLRLSTFRGTRRTHVKWKHKHPGLTIHFLFCCWILVFVWAREMREDHHELCACYQTWNHTCNWSATGIHFNLHLRHPGNKGAQLEAQQAWGMFPFSLKCDGEEEF